MLIGAGDMRVVYLMAVQNIIPNAGHFWQYRVQAGSGGIPEVPPDTYLAIRIL